MSERVREPCAKYELPYTTGSLASQYLQTLRTLCKLSLPNRFLRGQALDVGRVHTCGPGAPRTCRTSICWRSATPSGPGAAEDCAAISRARSQPSTSTSR